MNALDFLTKTTQEGASDLFIVAGRPLSYKKGGKITLIDEERVMPAQRPEASEDWGPLCHLQDSPN